jgi:hypothetical protein
MLVFRKNLESLSNEIIEKFIIMFERYPVNINDLQTFLNFQFTYVSQRILNSNILIIKCLTMYNEYTDIFALFASAVGFL